MTRVYTGASVSLDGYVAGPDDTGFDLLFAWMGNGDVAVPTADPEMTVMMTPENAEHWRRQLALTGAIVVGRHLYDLTHGWGGRHPMGVPVVVLTHEPPEERLPGTHYVTSGIEEAVAVASRLAGDKGVGLNAGTIATQAYAAGLLDEMWVDLVPVVLGAGRPFFDDLGGPVALEGPVEVTPGTGVTHLRYKVPGH